MKIVIIIITLLLNTVQAADLVRYVDTGSSGGDGTTPDLSGASAAYVSLSAWEDAEDGVTGNLVGNGDTMTVRCNRTGGGGMDTSPLLISGWTTSDINDITIVQDDFPSDGIFDSNAYVLHNDDSGESFFRIEEEYVNIDGLQGQITETSTNSRNFIKQTVTEYNLLSINKLIIKGLTSGTGTTIAIEIGDADSNVIISNTVIYDILGGVSSRPIYITDCNTVDVYNSTFFNSSLGIRKLAGTATITNSVVNATGDEFRDFTVVNCMSDDGDGTNPQGPVGGDWSNEFLNTSSGIFTVVADANVIGNGTDDPGTETDDITGTAWTSPWGIGAFQFVTNVGQVIMMRSW